MTSDLIKTPLCRTLLCALSVALVLCIAFPSPAMAAVPWGLNGTMKASNISLFLTRAFSSEEIADYLYTSPPLQGRNLYAASWNNPGAAQKARLGMFSIVGGDNPSFSIQFTQASATPRNAPIRPAVAYGYTGPVDWDGDGAPLPAVPTDNVMMAGGIDNDGAFSQVSVDMFSGIYGNTLQQALDSAAFADLPVGLAGAIATADSSANFYYDLVLSYGNVTMLLFGGENSTNHFTNDMYRPVYDTPADMIPSRWTLVTPNGTVPEVRADMAGQAYQGKWYVFGGRNDDGVFGDLWTYEFATKTWNNVSDFGFLPHSDAQFANATSQEGKALPYLPPARYGHSMGFISGENALGEIKDFIMLIGGTNGHTYFDDIWLLDPSSGNWEQITPASGQTSYTPRAYAGLFTSTNTSQAWVYGGHNNANGFHNNTLTDLYLIDFMPPIPAGPAFKSLPNNIIAGVAGGILLVLIITVIVLKVTDRNNN